MYALLSTYFITEDCINTFTQDTFDIFNIAVKLYFWNLLTSESLKNLRLDIFTICKGFCIPRTCFYPSAYASKTFLPHMLYKIYKCYICDTHTSYIPLRRSSVGRM